MNNEITKHAGGRPTKYNSKILSVIDEYLEECYKNKQQLASLEGLAKKLNVNVDTLYEWKKHEEFSEAIKKILERQKQQLMEDGFYGGKKVNANMGIFLLKVNHGLVEPGTNSINIQGDKVLVVPSELINKYEISQDTEPSSSEQSKI